MERFIDSLLFQELKPYIVIQSYDRDGGHKRPRKRIELSRECPQELVGRALSTAVQCPACGQAMFPFRMRRGRGDKRGGNPQHVYFAAACPERPDDALLTTWKKAVLESEKHDKEFFRQALWAAAHSFNTCCKGKAATDTYKAVIAVMEAYTETNGTPAIPTQHQGGEGVRRSLPRGRVPQP